MNLLRFAISNKRFIRVITRAGICCTKRLKKLHLFLTKVAFMRKHAVSNLLKQFIYMQPNAKYLQTLLGEKWRSFTYSLLSILKLHSTVHDVISQLWRPNIETQSKIPKNSLNHCTRKFVVFKQLSEAEKKLQKLALVITVLSSLNQTIATWFGSICIWRSSVFYSYAVFLVMFKQTNKRLLTLAYAGFSKGGGGGWGQEI